MPERWDVVLKILDGPLAGSGEVVQRGPVVRIGAQPGPGGFQLNGYRGLDARHCTITAYEGGTASIAPVGTNQVRMAPHANVNWKEIDPMGGPEYLSEGCALHLGPVGRGATLEFVECRRLGVWSGGALASEAQDVQSTVGPGGGPPAAFNARATKRIRSSSVPPWFIGCMVLMAAVFTVVPLAAVFIHRINIEPLGPVEEGEPFYKYATIKDKDINPKLKKGLNQPFHDFVMVPSIEASGMHKLEDPTNWDQKFYDKVAASVQMHLKAWSVFKRLDVVRTEYAKVLTAVRQGGLPDVIAAVPYLESRYNGSMQSVACAKGFWQFMPEVAVRINRDDPRLSFRVRNCKFKDAPSVLWSPTAPTPPPNVMKNAKYINPISHKCRISGCQVDDRTNLDASTQAAIFTLSEAWNDPDLRKSGSIVAITILSHNAGYDDSRFGRRKRSNLRDAWFIWSKKKSQSDWPDFYGDNITTDTPLEKAWNGSVLPPETQHYAYTIVAEHIVAVCYYGLNYADQIKAFKDYQRYTEGDGYCKKLDIPTAKAVAAHVK